MTNRLGISFRCLKSFFAIFEDAMVINVACSVVASFKYITYKFILFYHYYYYFLFFLHLANIINLLVEQCTIKFRLISLKMCGYHHESKECLYNEFNSQKLEFTKDVIQCSDIMLVSLMLLGLRKMVIRLTIHWSSKLNIGLCFAS